MIVPAQNIIDAVDLTSADALLPIYESVVNSIISLKKIAANDKKIEVLIERGDLPSQPNLKGTKTIKSVTIIDNGEGFTEKNYKSFETPFSKINKKYGCKGIGRFTILASYENFHVKSTYYENEQWFYREFNFCAEDEIKPIKLEESQDRNRKTIVKMENCHNSIIKDHTAKTVEDITKGIMQHCLIYYLCNDLPSIVVIDKEDEEAWNVNSLFKSIAKEQEKKIIVKGVHFHIYITKTLKENNRKNNYIYYCANSRVVGGGRILGKINSLFSYPILMNGKYYFLDIYVVSDYLNDKVYSARNGFKIPQENETDCFGDSNIISFKDIELEVTTVLENEYNSHVQETKKKNIKDLEEYIRKEAPRYRSFIGKEEILNSIPPNLSEEKKEEYLYKLSFDAKKKVDNSIQKFIDSNDINEECIQGIIQNIKDKTAYDTDSLADYIFRRRAIINLFYKFLDAEQDGKYKLEKDVHNLIFPMGLTNNEVKYQSHNLWLLDERFATYRFIASDKSITSVCQKKSSHEPDILLLNTNANMFDNPISFGAENSGEVSSMVIFEFKRPGETAHQKNKNDYRWEFSELVEKYFDDFIYAPDKKNYKGNQVIIKQTTPKFGYVIVDVIPPQLETYNLNKGWHKTPFNSYYKIIGELNMHIEVITFRNLLINAEKRHNPFFDKLFG
nr:hypothetical protein [Bacteroides intestinalis]